MTTGRSGDARRRPPRLRAGSTSVCLPAPPRPTSDPARHGHDGLRGGGAPAWASRMASAQRPWWCRRSARPSGRQPRPAYDRAAARAAGGISVPSPWSSRIFGLRPRTVVFGDSHADAAASYRATAAPQVPDLVVRRQPGLGRWPRRPRGLPAPPLRGRADRRFDARLLGGESTARRSGSSRLQSPTSIARELTSSSAATSTAAGSGSTSGRAIRRRRHRRRGGLQRGDRVGPGNHRSWASRPDRRFFEERPPISRASTRSAAARPGSMSTARSAWHPLPGRAPDQFERRARHLR
jgi:hypothetical protein